MDFEDWARLFESQSGKCRGCFRGLPQDWRTHVDHDHASGHVRGLLCNDCNMVLGRVKDDPSTLRRLAEYVEDSNTEIYGGGSSDCVHDAVWGD